MFISLASAGDAIAARRRNFVDFADFNAIEQRLLRGQRRVDGVERLKFDFHTNANCVTMLSRTNFTPRLPPICLSSLPARKTDVCWRPDEK